MREHDIKWFLADPTQLLQMKPFTRGGEMQSHGYEQTMVLNNTTMDVGRANLKLHPISQDRYLTEYYPDRHLILLNESIPHIKVTVNGCDFPMGMMDMTQTASFQKIIHAAHVRNLTANPLEFSIYEDTKDESVADLFGRIKQEWGYRDLEWNKYMAINTCKQVGNCAVLFSYDKEANRYSVRNYSYEDGYQVIPNYDEYGEEIARSLVYDIDGDTVIDTYDSKNHYRIRKNSSGGWKVVSSVVHGFPSCPLLIKRGKVAWEYAESSIEMWELLANINAIALKRFGTFALAFWGELDANSFQRDSSTLIVNLSTDTISGGKQDVKVLEFPEPQTMDKYLKTLEEKISLFSSTSFITPRDISTTNSGGNGIALAMSNDYALATQSALDWQRFMCDMVRLHQAGLDLETNGTEKYGALKVGAKIVPWSLETNNTKITNLATEAKYLSMRTIVESMPDAKPDEVERITKERGSLIPNDSKLVEDEGEKANRLNINRSNIIQDNN